MIVKVKGVGVKLAGKWCFTGKTAEVSKEEYELNKEYLEVIQDDEKSSKTKKLEKDKNSKGE